MAEETLLRGIVEFMADIGLYDVVLPFILVFTLVFAMLEKTAVLGHEHVGGKEVTKKNLNSMIAFVISFFVIASSQLVSIITKVSAQMVILLILMFLFLLLIGSFYKEGDKVGFGEGQMRNLLIAAMLIGIIFIFLNALTVKSGETWLEIILDFMAKNWNSSVVVTFLFIILVGIFIAWITKEPASEGNGGGGDD